MARLMSWRAVLEQGPLLPSGARRSVLQRRPVLGGVPVSTVVVRRMDGGVGGRSTSNCPWATGISPVTAFGPFLARSSGEGLREVSSNYSRVLCFRKCPIEIEREINYINVCSKVEPEHYTFAIVCN